MAPRPQQGSPAFDEVLAQAQASTMAVAALLPLWCRAAGLTPGGAREALGMAERHPRCSKLVRDARRALDRIVPSSTPSTRPGSGIVRMLGLKA